MSDIKQVQQRLLEMAIVIRNIFENNSIPYFITYGTLLGAVRHKGFIPWDDDFDFYLFDDSYDLALDCLRYNLPSNLILEYFDTEPLYFHDWAHVKDLETKVDYTHFPQDGIYSHHGLSIDLYRTKRIKRNEEILYRTTKHIEYLERKKNHGLISDTEYFERVFKLKQILDEQVKYFKQNTNNQDYIWAFEIFYDDRLTDDELFPLKKYEFENVFFLGPNNADVLLRLCYGDYMQLPPKERRKPHYENVIFLN